MNIRLPLVCLQLEKNASVFGFNRVIHTPSVIARRLGQRAEMSPEWTLQMGQNLNMSRRTGILIAIGVFVAIVIVMIVLSAY
jgi:hypothetical protein